jgi:hypothetical protein
MSFKILCEDSIQWLKSQVDDSIPNVITGIPDLNELNNNFDQKKYTDFFSEVSKLIFRKVKKDGYAIFIQTDRKINGQLIDKSYLLTDMAYSCGLKLVWHKIVCQRDVGKTDLFRPTYSHFLCYTVNGSPGVAFEDVLPVGGKLYENATPYNAAMSAAEFISKQIKKQKHKDSDLGFDILDPFVGQGTIGAAAIQKGLSFMGIDLDQEQCQLSNGLLEKVQNKGETP